MIDAIYYKKFKFFVTNQLRIAKKQHEKPPAESKTVLGKLKM